MKTENKEECCYDFPIENTYDYEYVGEWWIYDKETDEHLRTEKISFDVESEVPPEVWNKWEKSESPPQYYHDTMVENYSWVLVDFDDETEYHEGNEEYWRVDGLK